MNTTARYTDYHRALGRLDGILRGIIADGRVTTEEMVALQEWLRLHANLAGSPPFNQVALEVEVILSDGVVDREEERYFIEFCRDFVDAGARYHHDLTPETRELHGLLEGVACDGEITVEEARAVQQWLDERDVLATYFPFDIVRQVFDRVLADGRIDPEEHEDLLDICRQFMEIGPPPPPVEKDETVLTPEPWMQTEAPTVQTIDMICCCDAQVVISGKSFCLTGQARAGKRKDLLAEVEQAGGIPAKGVTKTLDYLVFGANSNPCWAYASYGRKIEKALDYQRKGSATVILHEDRFMRALQELL